MKIALCSLEFKNNNLEFNKNQIIHAIQTVNQNTDFLCFGEAFLQGFDCLIWEYIKDKKIAIHKESCIIHEIADYAKKHCKAVGFGYIEIEKTNIFSSYIVLSKDGEIICNFRRVSTGWKIPDADSFYSEGISFPSFTIDNLSFTMGLCGDLWHNENVSIIQKYNVDAILWPVYVDFSVEKWEIEKIEYGRQAKLLNKQVLLINSLCSGKNHANGASVYYKNGHIAKESLSGCESILIVEVGARK